MTRVNGSQRWSLVVDKKISILIALVVLDSPLCQINMSKSNKQRISQTGYYQIFCWNLFKDDTEASAFSDCYYIVWKMRILWPLKKESILQKQPRKSVLQICVLQLLLKVFKNVCEEVRFSKNLKWTPSSQF